MGIEGIIRPDGGKRVSAPFEIRFGESSFPVVCSNCRIPQRAGFFVLWKDTAVLVCIRCTANAIVKYQETHLFASREVEIDARVPPETVSRVIEEVVRENPDLPEEKVAKIARSAIEKI